MPEKPLILHTTPGIPPLPACDSRSLYYLALLQLQCPDRWSHRTGDWAVNGGSLPYITHLGHQLPLSHLHSLPAVPHPDSELSVADRGEALSWTAYIEGQVTDLIHHSLYSLPPNYAATIGKAHLSNLTFPKSQYIPHRIRAIHKARLQHVGLWGLGGMNEGDLADEDRKRLDELFVQAPGGTVAPRAFTGWSVGRKFEAERRKTGEAELVKRAKAVFEILNRRLGDRAYFFGSKPSSPDLELFANLTLVLTPSLPNPLLAETLKLHFPNLVAHHDRLLKLLFPGPESWSMIPRAGPLPKVETSWLDYLSPSTWLTTPKGEKQVVSSQDKAFARGRWLWFAGAATAMITYVFASGLVAISLDGQEDDELVEWDAEEIIVDEAEGQGEDRE